MLQRFARSLAALAAALAIALVGYGAGTGTMSLVAPASLGAQGPPLCEQDECALGIDCMHSGTWTGCNWGNENCETYQC